MELSRQEYWSGLPFPSPGDLSNPGIKPRSPSLQADSLSSKPPWAPIFKFQKTHPCMVMTSHGWPITLPSVPSPLSLQESLTRGGWQPRFWGKTHPLVPRCSGSRRTLERKTRDGQSISCQTWPSAPPACSMGLVGKDGAQPWWTQPLRSTLPVWRQGSPLRWTQPSRSIFAPGFVPFQDSRHASLMMVDSMALLLLSRRQHLSRPEEYTGCYNDAQTNIVCKLTTGRKGDSHRLFLP